MSYLNAYIDKCPSYGWQGGPSFKTLIVTMASGRESRNAEIAEAIHSFSIPFKNVKRDAYVGIKQMHLVCRGQLHCFRFRDQLDYAADDEVFGQGNGVQTVFQLRKVSTIDGVSYIRNCYAIKSATVNGGTASIDMERGTVTYDSPPTNGLVLTWDGEFDLWVRFSQDDLPFSIDSGNGSGEKFMNGTIQLIEQPPPPEES